MKALTSYKNYFPEFETFLIIGLNIAFLAIQRHKLLMRQYLTILRSTENLSKQMYESNHYG